MKQSNGEIGSALLGLAGSFLPASVRLGVGFTPNHDAHGCSLLAQYRFAFRVCVPSTWSLITLCPWIGRSVCSIPFCLHCSGWETRSGKANGILPGCTRKASTVHRPDNITRKVPRQRTSLAKGKRRCPPSRMYLDHRVAGSTS